MNYENVNKLTKIQYLRLHAHLLTCLKNQAPLRDNVYINYGFKSSANVTCDKWVYDLIEGNNSVGSVYFFDGIIYVKYKDSPHLFYYDVGLCRKFLKFAIKETKKNGKIKL